jgi:di/tricarboxylate transporter
LSGQTLGAVRFASEYGLQVVAIERDDERIDAPHAGSVIRAGDALVVRGSAEHLARIAERAQLKVSTYAARAEASAEIDAQTGDAAAPAEGEVQLAELMVPARSGVVGRTLRQLAFRTRYGVPVLGIQRHGVSIVERLGEVPLQAGDLLLVRGTSRELRTIYQGRQLALLGPLAMPVRRLHRLAYSTTIFAGVVLLAAFDVLPILVAALLGVLAMFLTGCVRPEEAYAEIDLMVVVLLASLIPLGIAMQSTGAAELLAETLLRLTTPLGLVGTMCALFLLTSLLTELISNNAAALVLTPIAIATAAELGVSPLPFVVTVMVAASNAFMTPIGYQTNLFVYGPGGYRFSDFARVGAPLNLLMLLTAAVVIPWFFPF